MMRYVLIAIGLVTLLFWLGASFITGLTYPWIRPGWLDYYFYCGTASLVVGVIWFVIAARSK